MDTKTVKLFAEYNRKTNAEMNRLIEQLTPAQWEQRWGGYYPTIQAICNHLYISDFTWLKRFGNLREFHCLEDDLFKDQLTLASTAFASRRDYLDKRGSLDAKAVALAAEVTEDDLCGGPDLQELQRRRATKEFRRALAPHVQPWDPPPGNGLGLSRQPRHRERLQQPVRSRVNRRAGLADPARNREPAPHALPRKAPPRYGISIRRKRKSPTQRAAIEMASAYPAAKATSRGPSRRPPRISPAMPRRSSPGRMT